MNFKVNSFCNRTFLSLMWFPNYIAWLYTAKITPLKEFSSDVVGNEALPFVLAFIGRYYNNPTS